MRNTYVESTAFLTFAQRNRIGGKWVGFKDFWANSAQEKGKTKFFWGRRKKGGHREAV